MWCCAAHSHAAPDALQGLQDRSRPALKWSACCCQAIKWLDENYGQGRVKGGQVSQQSKQGEDKQRAHPC